MSAIALTAHCFDLRVYYEDTDASGVVYHANYLKYFERARTEWLSARGLDHRRLANEHNLGFTLADVAVRFRRPARLDDRLRVTTRVDRITHVRVVFDQDIACGDQILVDARSTVACIALADFMPAELPNELRPRDTQDNASRH